MYHYATTHIVQCLLLLLLGNVLLLTGCGNIRQSQQTVATADSLDTEHILYRDTTALRHTVRTLDKPFVRQCHRTTLAKAYYYLGRNLEDNSLVAEAADCYISADRLQPHDYILRGRVNSCMGFICGQQNADSTALIFYQRAAEYFRKSGNEWRYAYGLLTISEYLCDLEAFSSADSVLQVAQHFQLDSIYYERLMETRGLYFYKQQQYDSALYYFLSIKDYEVDSESKCFLYQKIMQTYRHLGQEMLSIPYAEYVVAHSNTAAYRSNAYYVLEESAKAQKDINLLAYYAHKREDDSRNREALNCGYASAVPKLCSYATTPHPFLRWQIVVSLLSAVTILLVIVLLCVHYNKKKQISKVLQEKEFEIQTFNDSLAKQRVEHLHQGIAQFCTLYPKPSAHWKKYTVFQKDIQIVLPVLLTKLTEQNLSEQEIKLCVYIVLYPNITLSELSEYLCYSKNSMGTTKQRVAQKIGTTSAKLYTFLLQMESIG